MKLTTKFTCDLSPDLYMQLKIYSAHTGSKMSEIVEQALKDFFLKKQFSVSVKLGKEGKPGKTERRK